MFCYQTYPYYIYICIYTQPFFLTLFMWNLGLGEALCYKPEGREFDSRLCHRNFSLTLYIRPNCDTRVDLASNRNEYQEYFLRGKGGRCVGLTTLPPSCADCIKIWEPTPPGTIKACPGLQKDCSTSLLCFYIWNLCIYFMYWRLSEVGHSPMKYVWPLCLWMCYSLMEFLFTCLCIWKIQEFLLLFSYSIVKYVGFTVISKKKTPRYGTGWIPEGFRRVWGYL